MAMRNGSRVLYEWGGGNKSVGFPWVTPICIKNGYIFRCNVKCIRMLRIGYA